MTSSQRFSRLFLTLVLPACAAGNQTHLIDEYRAVTVSAAANPDKAQTELNRVEDEKLDASIKFGQGFETRELAAAEDEAINSVAAARMRRELLAVRALIDRGQITADLQARIDHAGSPGALAYDPSLKKMLFDTNVALSASPASNDLAVNRLLEKGDVEKARSLVFGDRGGNGTARASLECSRAARLKVAQAAFQYVLIPNACGALKEASDLGLLLAAGPDEDAFRTSSIASAKSGCLTAITGGKWDLRSGTRMYDSLRLLVAKLPASPSKDQLTEAVGAIEAQLKTLGGGHLWSEDTDPGLIAKKRVTQERNASQDARLAALEKAGKFDDERPAAESWLTERPELRSIVLRIAHEHPAPVVVRLRTRIEALKSKAPIAAGLLQAVARGYGDIEPIVSGTEEAAVLARGNVPPRSAPPAFLIDTTSGLRAHGKFECGEFIDALGSRGRAPLADTGWVLKAATCGKGPSSTVTRTDVHNETRKVSREIPSGDGVTTRTVWVDETVEVQTTEEHEVPNQGPFFLRITISARGKNWEDFAEAWAFKDDNEWPDRLIAIGKDLAQQASARAEAEQLSKRSGEIRAAYERLKLAPDDDQRENSLAEVAVLSGGKETAALDYFVKRYSLPTPVMWPFKQ